MRPARRRAAGTLPGPEAVALLAFLTPDDCSTDASPSQSAGMTGPMLPTALLAPIGRDDLPVLVTWLHERADRGARNGDAPTTISTQTAELATWLSLRDPVVSGLRTAVRLLACVTAGVRRDGHLEPPTELAGRLARHLDLPARDLPLARHVLALTCGALHPSAAAQTVADLVLSSDEPATLDAIVAVVRVAADYTTGSFFLHELTPGHVLAEVGAADIPLH